MNSRTALAPRFLIAVAILALAQSAVLAADTRLVVDVSGSMAETDPQRLLIPAVEGLIELLPGGEPASIWTFGRQVNRLMDHEPVSDLWRTQAQIKVRQLPAVGLRTALVDAVETASWDRARPAASRHLVLLTDGRLDVAESDAVNDAARARLVQTLLPELRAAGFKLHPVVLSELGDLSLLRTLADATGGEYVAVESPAALPERLADLMAFVRGGDQLPPVTLADDPSAPVATPPLPATGPTRAVPNPSQAPPALLKAGPDSLQQRVRIEASMAEATIFVRPLEPTTDEGSVSRLTGPDGQRYDQFNTPPRSRWHVAGPREVITLANPQAGDWLISGGRATRVNSYGELRLRLLDRPGQLAPGLVHALSFALEDARTGQPVAPALNKLVVFQATIEGEGGTPTASVTETEDGLSQVLIANLRGVQGATLTLTAEGPTFARVVRHRFEVAHPLRVDLQPMPSITEAEGAGLLWAAVNQPGLDSTAMTIAAGIAVPPAVRRWYPLSPQAAGLWQLELPKALRGAVEIELDVRAKYLNGGEFSYRTKPLRTELPVLEPRRLSFDDEGAVDLPIASPAEPRTVAHLNESALRPSADPQGAAGGASNADKTGRSVERPDVRSVEGQDLPTAAELAAGAASDAGNAPIPSPPLWLALALLAGAAGVLPLLWWLSGRRPVRGLHELLADGGRVASPSPGL